MTALSLNDSTGIAIIEAGKRLGNIALELNEGGRGIGHGTCPYVGQYFHRVSFLLPSNVHMISKVLEVTRVTVDMDIRPECGVSKSV